MPRSLNSRGSVGLRFDADFGRICGIGPAENDFQIAGFEAGTGDVGGHGRHHELNLIDAGSHDSRISGRGFPEAA